MTDRIATLDVMRGVAVLGILLLNIVAFGLVDAAYANPLAQGWRSSADLAAWLVNFVLFDGKMRGLFSVLFGASLLLVTERAAARGQSAAAVHYRRMGWLLAFGCAHLWLVWDGDILAHYALVGMIAYPLRTRPPAALVAIGVLLLALHAFDMGAVAHAAAGMDAAAAVRTGYRDAFGVPDAATRAAAVALHRGPYAALLRARFADDAWWPLESVIELGPETLAYMLFGMAALKSGMLAGAWSRAAYRRVAAAGLGVGILGYGAIAGWMLARGFAMPAVAAGTMAWPVPIRPAMIFGWAALVVLLMRPGGALTGRLAAAGRMAFSNYLLTSIACTTLFYAGGQYGAWSRAQLYLPVALIWAAILLWSPWWLARHRFGPFEWAWRSLARGRVEAWRGSAQ